MTVIKQFILSMTDVVIGSMALIVILTIFRADIIFKIFAKRKCRLGQKKKEIAIEFLKLIRDIVVAPLLIFVVITLYRVPSCFSSFLASASNPNAKTGACELTKMRFCVPKEKGSVTIYLYAKTKKQEMQQNKITSLRVLGKLGFWKNIEDVFGALAVQLGKGLQPLPVSCDIKSSTSDLPDHFSQDDMPKANEIVFVVKSRHRIKAKSIEKKIQNLIRAQRKDINEIDNDIFHLMLQFEDNQGKNVCNASLPLLQFVQEDGNVSVLENNTFLYNLDMFTADKLKEFWSGSKGAGFRESMWHILLLCTLNILIDITFFAMLLVSAVVPWRFGHALWVMNISIKLKNAEDAKYVLQNAYDLDLMLANHLNLMYTFINESGKTNKTTMHWKNNISTKDRADSQKSLDQWILKLQCFNKEANSVRDGVFQNLCNELQNELKSRHRFQLFMPTFAWPSNANISITNTKDR